MKTKPKKKPIHQVTDNPVTRAAPILAAAFRYIEAKEEVRERNRKQPLQVRDVAKIGTASAPKAVEPMVRRVYYSPTGKSVFMFNERDLPRMVEAMAIALHFTDDYELSYQQQAKRVLRAIGVEVES